MNLKNKIVVMIIIVNQVVQNQNDIKIKKGQVHLILKEIVQQIIIMIMKIKKMKVNQKKKKNKILKKYYEKNQQLKQVKNFHQENLIKKQH